MERGPRTITMPRPAAANRGSELSFRITAKQTKAPLVLGEFRPAAQPVRESPARSFNFRDTVPFVAPTLDFPTIKDTKPTPVNLRFGEFKPPEPVVTDKKVEPYYPEKFVDFPVPPTKKKEEEQTKEKTLYRYIPEPAKTKELNDKENTLPATEIIPVEQKLTDVRVALQEIIAQPKIQTKTEYSPTDQIVADTYQEEKGLKKKAQPIGTKKQQTKKPEQEEERFTFPLKREEKEQKRGVKFVKDRFAIAARKSRALLATTMLYAEKIYNTFGRYTGLEKYTVSGGELAGKMGMYSTDVVSGLSKKLGVNDNTLELVTHQVEIMPETESVGDAIDYINQVIDANPAVDVKNDKEAQGDEVAKPSDVVKVLAEALLP